MSAEHGLGAGVAWRVKFRRDRTTPDYKAEALIVVVPDGDEAALYARVRLVHDAAEFVSVERIGEAWVSA